MLLQGRIHQLEYAEEAVKQGSATVGLKNKTHAILVALKVITLVFFFIPSHIPVIDPVLYWSTCTCIYVIHICNRDTHSLFLFPFFFVDVFVSTLRDKFVTFIKQNWW